MANLILLDSLESPAKPPETLPLTIRWGRSSQLWIQRYNHLPQDSEINDLSHTPDQIARINLHILSVCTLMREPNAVIPYSRNMHSSYFLVGWC